jgi:hypothetical protein
VCRISSIWLASGLWQLVAIGGELRLVQFDQILGLTSGAVERLVNTLGRSSLDAGDDEANVEALGGASRRATARRSVFQDFVRSLVSAKPRRQDFWSSAWQVRMSSAVASTAR